MNLHVTIHGQGPDLVLLHGWAMHSGIFDALLPILAPQYRVHCIDLPGHGGSPFNSEQHNLEQWAAVILPHVPEQAIVLGWSLGGLIALKLAQLTALRALILVSTTPRFVATEDWTQGMSPTVFAQFFSHLQKNLTSTVEDFLRLQVRGDAHAADTFNALKTSLLQHPADPYALQVGLEILRDADERAALPNIKLPTLVIAGEYDRIAHPNASEYTAQRLVDAQYCLIKRAGHAPFISHRLEFLSEAQAFLHGIDRSREIANDG